jgi:chromosome segregation ATPase
VIESRDRSLAEGDETEQTARPIVAGAIEALAQQARRLRDDVFLHSAIRRVTRLLVRTDGRLAAAEDALAKVTAERDGLERQRDELRRELRAAKAVQDARPTVPIGSPRLALAPTNGAEPLAVRTRERDEARAQRDELIAAAEADRATIAALRAQLEAATQLPPAPSNGVVDVPPAEAVLNARRAQIVAEKDEIVAELARAARDPSTAHNRWQAKQARDALVKRLGEIDAEIRDINPRLKAARIARNDAAVATAQRVQPR